VTDFPVIILLRCSLKTRTFGRVVKMTVANIANAFRIFMSVRHSRFGYRNQVRGYGKTEYEHQGCRTYGTRAQNGKRKDFLGRGSFTAVPILFYFFFPTSVFIL
jgi:hypothetical protein